MLLFFSSVCFAGGGIFMKLSEGVSRLLPTLAFLALFVIGAVVLAVAMRRGELGVMYIAVLGLEAALTLVFSVAFFHESFSVTRILAVVLILVGVALLRGA
ncbi:DMT family transporter [Archangium lansingense]|uniref:SMR family transporter n=1 Tax=Archangium lansingense TaxID=2995310 RepID=A0ABT4A7V7_9BACT|nr:SMR family transporter [Archangium lansinium]MCY1077344.1 SMR family transporter [Archangium lansinium]